MPESSHLSALADDIPCGLLDVGADDRVVAANARLVEWLGVELSDIVGCTLSHLLSMGARIAYETHVRPMLRMEGQVEELAIDLLGANGERIPFIANARETRGEDGELHFTRFALFRAVDRRTYERTLRNARRMAEGAAAKEAEVAELRERFIAVLGHDLRNPLAVVLSGLNRIERGDGKPEQALLDAMRHSADRSVTLVNSVMDFARGRMGQGIPVERAPAPDLAAELERLVNETRILSPDREITSRWALDHAVEADVPRLVQLLANLLSNADHHGDPGTAVSVFGATTEDTFTLKVINKGAHLPPEACERLFEPFVQGETAGNARGLGLGLFIVSQIASAHGGAMDVVCADGEITFAFAMPRLAKAAVSTLA